MFSTIESWGISKYSRGLRRRVTAVRPEIKDGVQVGRQVVGELERATDQGGFDGILSEFFIGALLQDGDKIIFHGTHRFIFVWKGNAVHALPGTCSKASSEASVG